MRSAPWGSEMDVRINEVATSVEVRDAEALLTPAVMARIVAEVRRQLQEDEELRTRRDTDREPRAREGR